MLLHSCLLFTPQHFLTVLVLKFNKGLILFVNPVTGRNNDRGRPSLPNRRGPLHFRLQAGSTDLPGYRGGHHASKRARPAVQSYCSAARRSGQTAGAAAQSGTYKDSRFSKTPCSSCTSRNKTPCQNPSTWMWSSGVCQGEASAQTEEYIGTSNFACAWTRAWARDRDNGKRYGH